MIKNSNFLDYYKIKFNHLTASTLFKFIFILILFLTCLSCKNDRLVDKQINYQSKIEEINSKLEQSFKNGSIISEDLYVYILKSGDSLEFYCNLDYDSEGWPNMGHAYYFYKDNLIGTSNFFCDGCMKEDIVSKLKNMKIEKVKVPFENTYDKILCFDNLDDELRLVSNEKIAYARTLKSQEVCSICAKTFYHRGYQEVSEGQYEILKEGQGTLCSVLCAKQATENLMNSANSYYNKSNGSSVQDAPIQHYGEYNEGSDGRIYENNSCSLCKGSGLESGRNYATGEIEQRICPMCEGKGVRSY